MGGQNRVYDATTLLLGGYFKEAQKQIDLIEKDHIKRAGSKRSWYKYQKGD